MIYWHVKQNDLSTWNFILSILTKEDTTKTFIEPLYKKEHSLLTYLCSLLHVEDLFIEDKISSLIIAGCQWDQEVQERTALSFFVHSGYNFSIIKWCIRHGANPYKGNLLVYSSNWITESQYEKYLISQKDDNSISQFTLPVDACKCRPYSNLLVFDYLLEIGVSIHDTIHNGVTPLLAACCEGNEYKIKTLLSLGASLYTSTKDGINASVWIHRHSTQKWYQYDINPHSLVKIVNDYELAFWKEIITSLSIQETSFVPYNELLTILL